MESRMLRVERAESPVRSLNEPDRWRVPVEVSHEALLIQARELRTKALVHYAHVIGNALAGLWRKAAVEPVTRWLARERAIRELSLLNEHELHDLGIAPGMIPYLVTGKLNAEDEGRRAANENLHPKRAA